MACLLKEDKSPNHIYWKNLPLQADLVHYNNVYYFQNKIVYWQKTEKPFAIEWLKGKNVKNLT